MKTQEWIKNNPEYPVILDALIAWHKWDFEKSREDYRKHNVTILNPYFWEYGEFVEYVGVNKRGLIFYRDIQPGTEPDNEYHILDSSVWYDDYKPFHDRWMLEITREEKLKELL